MRVWVGVAAVFALLLTACTDSRTEQLAAEVARLQAELDRLTPTPLPTPQPTPTVHPALAALSRLILTPTASKEATPHAVETYELREPIKVDASDLATLLGQESLAGQVTITFLEVEYADGIEDRWTGKGTIQPRGKFVIVYYSARNDLNVKMQPATQISDDFVLNDDRGRQWETVDWTDYYGGVSGSAAVARGYERPETWVPPGFQFTTAAVYDVPLDATGLALVWSETGIRVRIPSQ